MPDGTTVGEEEQKNVEHNRDEIKSNQSSDEFSTPNGMDSERRFREPSTTSESANLVHCDCDVSDTIKSKKPKPSFSLPWEMFRYATRLDWVLIAFGSLVSVLHGFVLPVALLLLGEITDVFQFHTASKFFADYEGPLSQDFFRSLDNVAGGSLSSLEMNMNLIDVGQNVSFLLQNMSSNIPLGGGNLPNLEMGVDVDVSFLNLTNGVVNCSQILNVFTTFPVNYQFSFTIEDILVSISSHTKAGHCLENDDLIMAINPLILGLVGVALAALLLGSLQILLFTLAAERQVRKARLHYFNSILRQEREWYDEQVTGKLTTKLLEDFDRLQNAIGPNLSILIQYVATFVIALMVSFYSNWEITLILILIMPFIVVPSGIFNRLFATYISVERSHYASAGSVAEEVLSSVRTVVAFGGEFQEIDRYNGHLSAAKRTGIRQGLIGGVSLLTLNFALFFIFAVGVWYASYLVSNLRLNNGDTLAVFFSMLVASFYLGQCSTNMGSLMNASATTAPIFKIIDKKSKIDPFSDSGKSPEEFDGVIKFEDVTFSYPSRPEVTVLESFNLSVNKGECVAILGASGSGKSTIISLLQRFYDVTNFNGKVCIGGHDIRDLNVKWLRSHIGTVSQEPDLFNATIRENIRHGRMDSTMEEIIQAAKQANAHEFISSLPQGYNTNVGEQGVMLSGGQKQRVAIARAFIRNPQVLLLDEATSALDTENENILRNMLKSGSGKRTVIFTTHRLPLVKCADTVLIVDGGRVSWKGTPSQLFSMKGLEHNEEESEALIFKLEQKAPSVSTRGHSLSLHRQNSGLIDYEDEEDDKKYNDITFLWKLFALNKAEWWAILLGVLAAGVNGAFFPVVSIMFGGSFDVFAEPLTDVIAAITPWAFGFIGLAIIAGIASFVKTISFSIAGDNLTRRVRLKSFTAMLRQEISWFDRERNTTGVLLSRLTDDARNVQGISGFLLGTVVECSSTLLVAHVISFGYNWSLTILLMGVIPFYILSGWIHSKASLGLVQLKTTLMQKATENAVEVIQNIKTVTSLGLEEQFFNEYKVNNTKPTKYGLAMTSLYGVSQSVLILGYIIAFRYGAFQVTLDESSVLYSDFYDVLQVFTAVVFATISISLSNTLAPDYTAAKVSAGKIITLLERKPNPDGFSEQGYKLKNLEGKLSMENISFRYPSRPETKVLKNVSLRLDSGQTLALVGVSGGGKSTVFSLLERFYDISSGKLKWGSYDYRDLNIRWLRSKIGIVSQEPILFDMSISDNITYGLENISTEQVVEASKAANIHSFITTLPQGYATNVGARGARLSGGQKQRIAIARALVRKPALLLLDEATSALDNSNEEIVQEALDRAQKGCTTLVITHRLATVQNADVIAVMKAGHIVEVGDHKRLMEKKGEYYRMECMSNL